MPISLLGVEHRFYDICLVEAAERYRATAGVSKVQSHFRGQQERVL